MQTTAIPEKKTIQFDHSAIFRQTVNPPLRLNLRPNLTPAFLTTNQRCDLVAGIDQLADGLCLDARQENPGLVKDCLATDQLRRWCPGPWGKRVLNRIHW